MYQYKLPQKLPYLFEELQIFWGNSNEKFLCELTNNAKFIIDEYTDTYTDWGIDHIGHKLNIFLPLPIFSKIKNLQIKQQIAEQLKKSLNDISDSDLHEYFAQVTINLQQPDEQRLPNLMTDKRFAEADVSHIWDTGFVRAFISHKDKDKNEVEKLNRALKIYGISGFVAHTSIEPTKEWKLEIEKALASMDILVAYITDEFNTGAWTNQEIGYAIGAGINVIPVKIGLDPSGLISHIQAVPKAATTDLLADNMTKYIYEQIPPHKRIDGIITALKFSHSYNCTSKILIRCNEYLKEADDKQKEKLIEAFETNSQVYDSFEAKQQIPEILKEITGKNYSIKGRQLKEIESPIDDQF